MHFPKWWSESIMRGIDENRMLNRGLATTLAVLAACVGAGHPVHAEWTPPEELSDWDREIAQADPEEAMALRRKRIVWREQHLEPNSSPARVALDHAEDVLLVHLRSGSNAFRQLWTWPLVVPRNVKPFTPGFALWTNGAAGMATLDQEIAAARTASRFRNRSCSSP